MSAGRASRCCASASSRSSSGRQAVSVLGDGIFPIALAFAVLDLGGSPTDLGIVLIAGILPQTVFVLIGGVWADRLPRRTIMVVVRRRARRHPGGHRGAPAERARRASGSWSCSTRCTPRPRRSSCPPRRRSSRRSTPHERLQQANALLGITRSIAFGDRRGARRHLREPRLDGRRGARSTPARSWSAPPAWRPQRSLGTGRGRRELPVRAARGLRRGAQAPLAVDRARSTRSSS